MALKVPVKVSGVSNLSDARYCAGMGVQWLGFSVNPESPTYSSPEQFKEIASWIEGVSYVGEVHDMAAQAIAPLLDSYAIDAFEVNEEATLQALPDTGLPIFFNIDLQRFTDSNQLEQLLQAVSSRVSYFVVEGEADQQTIANVLQLASQYPILLGSGVEPEVANDFITSYPLAGLALRGSEEIKPGYKDYDGLAEVLEAIEKEDWE